MDRCECGHCGKRLSIKSLKEHRRLYFHDGKWLRNDEQDLRDRSSRSSSPISVSDIESNPSVDLKNEDMQQLYHTAMLTDSEDLVSPEFHGHPDFSPLINAGKRRHTCS